MSEILAAGMSAPPVRVAKIGSVQPAEIKIKLEYRKLSIQSETSVFNHQDMYTWNVMKTSH